MHTKIFYAYIKKKLYAAYNLKYKNKICIQNQLNRHKNGKNLKYKFKNVFNI